MYVFLVSVLLLFIGSFLPWATVGPFNVSGIEGDGVITLIASVIAIILYFALKKKPKIVKIMSIFIGALSLIIVFVTFSNIGETPFGSSGSGLIVVLLGSIGLIVSAFLKQR